MSAKSATWKNECCSGRDVWNLRAIVENEIRRNKFLTNEISIEVLNKNNVPQIAALYRDAYLRGDWFGSAYSNPEETVFNKKWLSKLINHPDIVWIVFREKKHVVGATALINHERYVSIDETQLDPVKGRKKGIMSSYFRRFIRILQEKEIPLSTEFVLTPESYSLRKVLIGELGMQPTGLLPNVLYSQTKKIYRSEITAIWVPDVENTVKMIPGSISEVEMLYNIITGASDKTETSDKTGAADATIKTPSCISQPYTSTQIKADNCYQQNMLRSRRYYPVELNLLEKSITFSKFSFEPGEYDFIYDESRRNSSLDINSRLVDYIKTLCGGKKYV